MKTLLITWAILTLLVAVYSNPLPNHEGVCGRNNKVKVFETVLDSAEIDDSQVHFVSEDNQIVFVRTKDGHVWRSDNEGITWTKETVPEKMSKIDEYTYLIDRIFYSQAKDGVISIYLLGGGGDGMLWVSRNGGKTYEVRDTLPSGVHWIETHPMYPGTALASKLGTQGQLLYFTSDHGATWNLLPVTLTYAGRYTWSPFDNTNPNRIYVMRYKEDKTVNYYAGEIVYSDDWFVTTNKVPLQNVFNFLALKPNKFLVGTCSDTVSCESKELHISEDSGKTFHLAVFPDKRKDSPEVKSYSIFEISDNAIWTNVRKYCSSDLCWGDLFHSNAADDDFTLSLPYHRNYDFVKYQSVDGIYVANQYITGGDDPTRGDAVRTVITFNKGSQWDVLKAPEKDSNKQPLNCKREEGCSLHLHGWYSSSESFSYFYSIPNAVGLMIATGNVGKLLKDRANEINTYYSINGGKDWNEIKKGAWVPEIGDHGSIIVLADQENPTTEIIYTINEGDEWLNCVFTNDTMDVVNIRVSEGWDSRRFVLYGKRVVNGVVKPVLIHLNFDDAFSGQCKEENDDFEKWSPKNEHGHCVLGQETIYYRKKYGTNCYFGEKYDKKTVVQNCACNEDDYECEHCFYRPDLSSPCTLECLIPNMPPEPAYCANSTVGEKALTFTANIGYRLIDDDKCDPNLPGATKPKGVIPCKFKEYVNGEPDGQPGNLLDFGNSPILVASLVVIAIVLLVGGIWFAYKNSETFHDFVKNTFGIGEEADFNYSQVNTENEDQERALTLDHNTSDEDTTV